MRIAIALLCLLGFSGPSFAQQRPFILSVGGFGGTSHAAGSAICRLNNQLPSAEKSNCLVAPSKGSIDNLTRMRTGELRIGVATPDAIAAAYTGTGAFQGAGPNKDLKTLFSLNPAFMMLVVSKNSSINKIEDMRGKHIYTQPGSSDALVMESIWSAFGMDSKLFQPTDLSSSKQSEALCKGEIEVFFAYAGGGAKYINNAMDCGARLIPIAGQEIEKVIKANPTLKVIDMPPNVFHGQKTAMKTLSGLSTIVATSQLSADEAYNLVKATFDNFDNFRKAHPAFEILDQKIMCKEGLGGVPLHEGAARYFREKGLI